MTRSPPTHDLQWVDDLPASPEAVALEWLGEVAEGLEDAGITVDFAADGSRCSISLAYLSQRSITIVRDSWVEVADELNRRFPGKEAARGG